MSKVVIEALYPEFSNLYGDRGNLLYLRRKLELAGAEVELLETSLFETPAFAARDDVGFLYLGPCTERQQELELKALRPYREALLSRMDGAAVTLATGNAFELFGEKILRADSQKSEIKALGFWNTYAERFSRLRYNELCVGECGDISVTGFKNQLSHSLRRNTRSVFENAYRNRTESAKQTGGRPRREFLCDLPAGAAAGAESSVCFAPACRDLPRSGKSGAAV